MSDYPTIVSYTRNVGVVILISFIVFVICSWFFPVSREYITTDRPELLKTYKNDEQKLLTDQQRTSLVYRGINGKLNVGISPFDFALGIFGIIVPGFLIIISSSWLTFNH